jgi:formylglycine-generating enzyme required for sulfatase activity
LSAYLEELPVFHRLYRLYPFTLLAVFVLAAILPSWGQDAERGRKFALLVGVSKYKSAAFRPLEFAEKDVTDLKASLAQLGYRDDHSVLMTNTVGATQPRFTPDGAGLRKELAAFLKLPRAEDTLLIALAGHGVQLKGEKEHYFCPTDADLTRAESLLSLTDLYKELEKCKAGFKLLLVDACRDNPLSKDAPRSASDKVPDSLTRPELPDPPGGVAAFFSCSKGQQAFENSKLGHGVFFHFLLQGLKGEAKDREGRVTLSALEGYVSREVPTYVFRNHDGADQVPELFKKTRGDAVLTALANRKDDEKSLGMKFVTVPKGTFWMGGGGGIFGDKEVAVDEFQIAIHEVTQGQWQALMGSNPSWFSRGGEGKDKVKDIKDADLAQFPVEQVSWDDAKAFIKQLNEKERDSGWTYRLPSEAEWEYACRGGATSKEDCSFHFYFDDKLTNDISSDRANFNGSAAKGRYLVHPAKVGSYRPNKLSIHDMHGNVWEWCEDSWDRGPYRVFRGGSWSDYDYGCRVSSRYRAEPAYRSDTMGFRLARGPSR